MKINPSLEDLIEPREMEAFKLINAIENSSLIITQEHIRYLRSKFRVRVPIHKSWDDYELKLNDESKLYFLNREISSQKMDRCEKVSRSDIVKLIYSSSKFELSFMFDLYNLYKSRFGISIDCFEDFDEKYVLNLSSVLAQNENLYQYYFNEHPKKEALEV